MNKNEEYNSVLNFWFQEAGAEKWFAKDAHFDQEIKDKFFSLHQRAAAGELWEWRALIRGRLAEIIILDQFSRNLFREDYRAFENDKMALVLAQEAIKDANFHLLSTEEKAFVYMPFMHSESLKIQEQSLKLFEEEGLERNYKFAKEHYEIIKKFGRYPHRNEILKRESTQEELAFLKTHAGF